jgi:hypothetical protein
VQKSDVGYLLAWNLFVFEKYILCVCLNGTAQEIGLSDASSGFAGVHIGGV